MYKPPGRACGSLPGTQACWKSLQAERRRWCAPPALVSLLPLQQQCPTRRQCERLVFLYADAPPVARSARSNKRNEGHQNPGNIPRTKSLLVPGILGRCTTTLIQQFPEKRGRPTWIIFMLMRFVTRVSCMKASTLSVLILAGACT